MPEGLIVTVPVTADAQVIGNANGTYYCGFTLREAAGAVAVVRLRKGTVTGDILDTIAFAANEAVADYYGEAPLWTDGKIYVQLVSGTIPEGSLRVR